ncbi:MAG: diphosphate--fructose-6-phosphate 1-phosphotransferase [Spirochaetae bacterium HGW-Spirochaetae-1]|nr:MAG: diphosphate--fructose-6-phosphate 1-phosphotransferase [Spirochaetae bacterium HGW-Spirochaetae-1]
MNFIIKSLGENKYRAKDIVNFAVKDSYIVSDEKRLLHNIFIDERGYDPSDMKKSFELAGPREKLFFDPKTTKCAIVTCGGLCPGLNDVIRSIVMESYYRYGVRSIIGIRYGYNGLNPAMGYHPIELTPELVESIHMDGGTILGSSRGGTDDMEILVNTLENMSINILYTIGGDGTLRGAHKINEVAKKRGYDLSVVGIPKTIDNDISFIQRSFGFETAFSKASDSIYAAHAEAKGAPNGIGLVKLMGRQSGFIAANATLAMNDVNYVLVPEVPFDLYGDHGFLNCLEKRLLNRGHAVICVAEGAGQDLIKKEQENRGHDASGNIVLDDIGIFLKHTINEYFKEKKITINLKYIDPSYIIRSAPAVPNDSIFCAILGQYAVHAGMAGKTDLVIGQWNNVFIHIPIELAISSRKQIDPNSPFWNSVLEATGQPASMVNAQS